MSFLPESITGAGAWISTKADKHPIICGIFTWLILPLAYTLPFAAAVNAWKGEAVFDNTVKSIGCVLVTLDLYLAAKVAILQANKYKWNDKRAKQLDIIVEFFKGFSLEFGLVLVCLITSWLVMIPFLVAGDTLEARCYGEIVYDISDTYETMECDRYSGCHTEEHTDLIPICQNDPTFVERAKAAKPKTTFFYKWSGIIALFSMFSIARWKILKDQ